MAFWCDGQPVILWVQLQTWAYIPHVLNIIALVQVNTPEA